MTMNVLIFLWSVLFFLYNLHLAQGRQPAVSRATCGSFIPLRGVPEAWLYNTWGGVPRLLLTPPNSSPALLLRYVKLRSFKGPVNLNLDLINRANIVTICEHSRGALLNTLTRCMFHSLSPPRRRGRAFTQKKVQNRLIWEVILTCDRHLTIAVSKLNNKHNT